MGYNTPVLILNDAMDNLKTDADVGRKMYEAMLETPHPSKRVNGVSFSIGNHCNGGMVLPSAHADDVQVIAVGYNYMRRLGTVYNVELDNPEMVLKQLADSLGYRLVKRASK
jgi:hypothetical protein